MNRSTTAAAGALLALCAAAASAQPQPTQTAAEMSRRNPHILIQEVAGASHYVHDDNLPGFEAALHAFLRSAALHSWASGEGR